MSRHMSTQIARRRLQRQLHGEWNPDNETDASTIGTLGIATGNWGGNWHYVNWQKHMEHDVKSNPGAIMLLQEARPGLADYLESPKQ